MDTEPMTTEELEQLDALLGRFIETTSDDEIDAVALHGQPVRSAASAVLNAVFDRLNA